jgi:hypothetical protein
MSWMSWMSRLPKRIAQSRGGEAGTVRVTRSHPEVMHRPFGLWSGFGTREGLENGHSIAPTQRQHRHQHQHQHQPAAHRSRSRPTHQLPFPSSHLVVAEIRALPHPQGSLPTPAFSPSRGVTCRPCATPAKSSAITPAMAHLCTPRLEDLQPRLGP